MLPRVLAILFAMMGFGWGDKATARTLLTTDAFINITTSDSIQATVDDAFASFDWNGKNVTIQLAAGNYFQNVVIRGRAVGQYGTSTLTIRGNPSNPVSTIIVSSDVDAVLVTEGAQVAIAGIQAQTSGTQGNAFSCSYSCHLKLTSFGVGSAAGYQISTAYNSTTEIIGTSYYIAGSAPGHYYTVLNSQLLVISTSVTLNAGQGFPIAFLIGAVASYSHLVDVAFINTVATGARFYLYMGATYSDGTQHPRASYLPGNSAGVLMSNATYNNDTQ